MWGVKSKIDNDAYAEKVLATLWPLWDPSADAPAKTAAPSSGKPGSRCGHEQTAANPGALVDQLSALIAWRKDGHLTDSEFQNAKGQLGLA